MLSRKLCRHVSICSPSIKELRIIKKSGRRIQVQGNHNYGNLVQVGLALLYSSPLGWLPSAKLFKKLSCACIFESGLGLIDIRNLYSC